MRLSSSVLGWSLVYLPLISAHNVLSNRDAQTVTVYAQAPSSPPSASYSTDSILIDSTLNSTNHFRDQHNATSLTWNTSLADAASSWASKCQWKHSGGPTGENLALGYPDMTSAIDAWGIERDLYDFNVPTGFSKATGHFTQLVWKDTTSVGCAAVDCNSKNSLKGYVVVCEYWPPGNMVGQENAFFRANVQGQVQLEAPQSSVSILPIKTTSSVTPTTTTRTATVAQVVTSANYMPTKPRAGSTVWALGEEAAADQLEVKSRGQLAMGVAIAAMVVAGAIG
jgi:Cysteine-rich secretory protein family